MTKTRIIQTGDSLAIVLPDEILNQLKVGNGDELSIAVQQDGIFLGFPDVQKVRQLELARQVMRENRQLLQRLAQ